jgi:hypothetical protein
VQLLLRAVGVRPDVPAAEFDGLVQASSASTTYSAVGVFDLDKSCLGVTDSRPCQGQPRPRPPAPDRQDDSAVLLRVQRKRGRGPCRTPPRCQRDDIGKDECGERDDADYRDRHGRVRYSVDVSSEQRPELSA